MVQRIEKLSNEGPSIHHPPAPSKFHLPLMRGTSGAIIRFRFSLSVYQLKPGQAMQSTNDNEESKLRELLEKLRAEHRDLDAQS